MFSSSSWMVISPERRPKAEPLPLREWEPEAPPPCLPLEPNPPKLSVGPLKRFFFRFAKDMPEEKGFGDPGDCDWLLGMPSLYSWSGGGAGDPRTRRMLDGNEFAVGVAGSTLTEWCGEWPRPSGVLHVETDPAELVDEAFE